jgi:hypothetical protein
MAAAWVALVAMAVVAADAEVVAIDSQRYQSLFRTAS